jgi:DMSO/TMAO reductase YedYZ heme-binding membrane subunit
MLHGAAYLFWTISLLPIVWELWRIARQGLASLTDRSLSLESGTAAAD